MSKFRTIERSDPRFERDGLSYVTFKSPNLKSRGDYCIFIPDVCKNTTLPLIILLHGVYGSHWAWTLKAGVHHTAQRMIDEGEISPIVILMPSDGLWGDGSAYLAHRDANYEKWIVEDLFDCSKECFEEINDNSNLFISGLSMGGYGALRLGAKYPLKFQGISAHSSITEFNQLELFVEEPLDKYGVDYLDYDILYWIKKNKSILPPIRFDCGIEDKLIEGNRDFHERLLDEQIEHHYEEFPGAHTWDYWEEHVKDTLYFFDNINKGK